jgi:hypothetical protein
MKCALMPMLRCNKILVVAAVCIVITVSAEDIPRPDYRVSDYTEEPHKLICPS